MALFSNGGCLMDIMANPILRWAGSKRKLLKVLLPLVPSSFERYIEPFAGSACLFFALSPKNAVLNDINSDLIHFYRSIRVHGYSVYRKATGYIRTKEQYASLRQLVPNTLSETDRAARFFLLNRLCYNGLYRTNKVGHFNVPMGKNTGAFPSPDEFMKAAEMLRRATLFAKDFEEVVAEVRSGDFVYLDPPYYSPLKRRRNEYGNRCFTTDELPRLIESLRFIDRQNATFLLSFADEPTIVNQLSDYQIHRVSVRRHISGFATRRAYADEVVVANRRIE